MAKTKDNRIYRQKSSGPRDDFRLHYKKKDEKHFLIVTPIEENQGFLPKEIEITLEQWNDLRYHFAVGIADAVGDTKLAYVV